MQYIKLSSNQYPGGKGSGGVYQNQINQIPPHRGFFSGFLGFCKVTQHKRPAESTYGFDRDESVIKEWEMGLEKSEHFDSRNFYPVHRSFFDVEMFAIAKHLQGDLYVYLDPPYLKESRKNPQNIYKFEMKERAEHEELISRIKAYEWPCAICTLPNDLYDKELSKWRVLEYETVNRSGEKVTEFMYMNYEQPEKLHDYNYIGSDFREREKRQRRFNNFLEKWNRMDYLDKAKIIQEIESEVQSEGEYYTPDLIAQLVDTADQRPSSRKRAMKPGV